MEQGRIVRALSGFYYVEDSTGEIVECRARGRFRKDGLTPLVGDLVSFTREGKKGTVAEILPRKNCFVRPAIANLDLLVVFASGVIPVTEPFLIDRIFAIAGNQNVPVVLCVNKCDLDDGGELCGIYRRAGFTVISTSAETGQGVHELRSVLSGKYSAFTGNSGVGKSSILNRLDARLELPTGEVSEKLGRGRHTTRHVEIYRLPDGTCVADTPGFSSFDTERMDLVLKENLQFAFCDFSPFVGRCQFRDCSHRAEPGCAIRGAVERGAICPSRYDSYLRLYEKAKDYKPWE